MKNMIIGEITNGGRECDEGRIVINGDIAINGEIAMESEERSEEVRDKTKSKRQE